MQESHNLSFYDYTSECAANLTDMILCYNTKRYLVRDADMLNLEKLRKKNKSLPYAVTGADVGFSAGCFPDKSLSYVLPVTNSNLKLGEVYRIGRNIEDIDKQNFSLLQLVLVRPENTLVSMNNLLAKRSLTGIMPGFMAKSFGVATSVKVHRKLQQNCFTSDIYESMVVKTFSGFTSNYNDITLIFGVDCDGIIEKLSPLIVDVDTKLSEIKKSYIKKNFDECALDLNCSSCEESVICDNIKKLSTKIGRDK